MARDLAGRERERRRRRARVRRQRLFAAGLVALVLGAAGVAIGTGGGGHPRRGAGGPPVTTTSSGPAGTTTASAPPPREVPSSFAVGIQTEQFVDTSRTVKFLDGATEPRALTTYIRYPALGATNHLDVKGATPDSADGPYPLIVFGHGYDVEPSLYKRLLDSWAQAGYVVAAPVFPLESPDAPGGPLESDLVNQPLDMEFVIEQLLQESAGSGPLAGMIDPNRIAVAGQSDGGDTALALAYDPRFRDRRIDAAAILSGAKIPFLGSFSFPLDGPPLLAAQGTADTVNFPTATAEYFAAAHRPKYLLGLLGAQHLPPYSVPGSQLAIVERTTLAFFNAYLKHRQGALQELNAAGRVPGKATLQAEP